MGLCICDAKANKSQSQMLFLKKIFYLIKDDYFFDIEKYCKNVNDLCELLFSRGRKKKYYKKESKINYRNQIIESVAVYAGDY